VSYEINQASEIIDKETNVIIDTNNILSENCHFEDDMYIPLYQSLYGEESSYEKTITKTRDVTTNNQSYDNEAIAY